MKSFFKKLAFVMALAMVVTLAAPAAKTAVAADKALAIGYQNGMAITEVNIANIGDGEDLRFLYAPANWKELGVKWTSSNENVATVDSNGFVTAVAAGSATVSVAVGTETASVVVNVVDLPTYTVSIGEGEDRDVTEWTLEIGEAVDFAFYGVKDYSRDKIGAASRYACQWGTDDPTVLSNDGDGVFTALKAGTAKATLMVLNVVTNKIHNVIPVTVTVNAPVVEEPEVQDIVAEINKTQDTFEITFDKATDLGLADVEVYRVFFADDDNNGDGVIDDRDLDYAYESVYVDTVTKNNDEKLVYTVNTFDDFIDGVTYEVRVAGYEPERFVASVGEVAKVVVNKTKTPVLASEDRTSVEGAVDVTLYDAKGVNVTTRVVDGIKNNDPSNINYWLVEESDAYSLGYNTIEFYEMATAKVMATFQNSNVTVDSAEPAIIVPDRYAAYGVAEIVAWTLVLDGKTADWTKPVTDVPAGEENYTIATLLKDTRGQYFTTHEASAGADKYTDNKGVKHTVYWTENENEDFWINGLYVEYRAMNPDKMLVEDYGRVKSYEKGKARFALYLYDYNLYNDEFVKELYSQYVNVCHPMELNNFTASATNVSIMMNTKEESVADAYYSKFSTTKVELVLKDIHGGDARADHAEEADYTVTLLSNKLAKEAQASYDALKALVEETYDGMLDGTAVKRTINITANDFAGIEYRTQVKFKITEKVTGKSVTVTVNLKKLAETEVNNTVISDVAVVKEYIDTMTTGTYDYFEKFKVNAANAVTQYIHNGAKDAGRNYTGYWTITLKQADKNNNEIGYDNDLFFANNTLKVVTRDDVIDGDQLEVGDRILTVKGPDGKVFPVIGTESANPDNIKKLADTVWATPATTSAFGVTVEAVDSATAADETTATSIMGYRLYFRAVGDNDELIFAKDGKYTATIQTIEAIDDADGGKIYFTSSTNLKTSVTTTVSNDNPQVTYKSRDLTRIEDSVSIVDADAKIDDEATMCQYILDAFNFNLGTSAWGEGTKYGELGAEDILCYTYTVTPTNKQIVINTVTFKVPVLERDDNGNVIGEADTWYRSTATVNKSLTFDYEY